MLSFLLQCGVVLLLGTTGGLCLSKKQSYDGYILLNAMPDTEEKVEYVNSLEENYDGEDVEIWVKGAEKNPFEILLSPNVQEEIQKELAARQIVNRVKNPNIEKAIRREKSLIQPRTGHAFENSHMFKKYLTFDEITSFLQHLNQTSPIITLGRIGKTHERRNILAVKIGSDVGNATNKPAIWIDGGIHAREWISVSTTLYMINWLVTQYEKDETIRAYVDKVNWYFIPVLNVDGYVYSHTTNRMWRKNRRPAESPCTSRKCCDGVDLNRNFGYNFGGNGTASDNTCSYVYRGQAAFSEPETQAVKDFILKHSNDLKAYISLHAYSQLWFYPNVDGSQENDDLRALSKKAADAIEAVNGVKLEVGRTDELLYAASGGSFDWVKNVANVKYSFTLELRPEPGLRDGSGFILPPTQIVPVGEETWAGIRVVVDEVIRKYLHSD